MLWYGLEHAVRHYSVTINCCVSFSLWLRVLFHYRSLRIHRVLRGGGLRNWRRPTAQHQTNLPSSARLVCESLGSSSLTSLVDTEASSSCNANLSSLWALYLRWCIPKIEWCQVLQHIHNKLIGQLFFLFSFSPSLADSLASPKPVHLCHKQLKGEEPLEYSYECQCQEECPPRPAYHRVCGSDGHTYESHCHIHREACVSNRRLEIVGQGVCSGEWASYCNECKPTLSQCLTSRLVYPW